MKHFIITLIFLGTFHSEIMSQYHFVHIAISMDSTTAYSVKKPLFITGNDIMLGSWNPRGVVMNPQNDTVRMASLMLAKGQKIEFCFTDGKHAIISSDSTLQCPLKHLVRSDTTLLFRYSPFIISEDLFKP